MTAFSEVQDQEKIIYNILEIRTLIACDRGWGSC